MFEADTVFVLGAGASAEVKLPVGGQLTSRIASLVNMQVDFGRLASGDPQIYETIRGLVQREQHAWVANNFFASGRHIAEAMALAPSIDTFVETYAENREIVLLSKLGIAKAILAAEAASLLAPNRERNEPFQLTNVTDTWFTRLARLLFTGVRAGNPAAAFENVTFINFNYDRCLEVFLLRALRVNFQMAPGDAEEILNQVRIYRPYGSLGPIVGSQNTRVPFGDRDANLLLVAEWIDTFSEKIRDQQTIHAIRNAVDTADNLIFLGFAFHQQNMNLLTSPERLRLLRAGRPTKVLATTLGISDADTKVVRDQLSLWAVSQDQIGDPPVYTHNAECKRFFDEYWRTMMA